MPNNTSKNKLTRIVEHVFVFCRKDEFKTFEANKKVKSIRKTGQKMYENVYNFIEAKNNDKVSKLNKATYSTELILKLMDIYCKDESLIYDPFSGTCTTQNACIIRGFSSIGSEISENQIIEGIDRLNETKSIILNNKFNNYEDYIEFIHNKK